MTNLINTYIAKQPLNTTNDVLPEFSVDIKDEIQPMSAKGRLLPSRIFGSPVEYTKDLKQDVVNIGRAAKGDANDHELGRINDLAMKTGSLALAAYLFVKNPLKLGKVMEFVGFGTFFASMALWPKLAIQAPLKARTGVDIHQKYVDSQGRKKMLFQDPQYILTDLYSKEDLDKMGKKMGVDENLPDRDSFIKQRAQKTALQGNTLWMMTAGFATPIMSALSCNLLEKPIGKVLEKQALSSSERALNSGSTGGIFAKIKQMKDDRAFNRYLEKHANETMDAKHIDALSGKIGSKLSSASAQAAAADEIKMIEKDVKIDKTFVENALNGKISKELINSLNDDQKKLFNQSIEEGSITGIANALSQANGGSKRQQVKLAGDISRTLEKAKENAKQPKVKDAEEKLRLLYSDVNDFARREKVMDKYIDARVGDKSGTYIANQWERITNKFIKSLNLSRKELKAVSMGDMSVIDKKLAALASNEAKYNKTVKELMKLTGEFEQMTGSEFSLTVKQKANEICAKSGNQLKNSGFETAADKVYKYLPAEPLKEKIVHAFIDNGKYSNDGNINDEIKRRMHNACQKFFKDNTTADYTERLHKAGNGLEDEKQIFEQIMSKVESLHCKEIMKNSNRADYNEKLKAAAVSLSDEERGIAVQNMLNAERVKIGTVENTINVKAKERAAGAQSSFYRILQSLDLSQRIKDGSLEKNIESMYTNFQCDRLFNRVTILNKGFGNDSIVNKIGKSIGNLANDIQNKSTDEIRQTINDIEKAIQGVKKNVSNVEFSLIDDIEVQKLLSECKKSDSSNIIYNLTKLSDRVELLNRGVHSPAIDTLTNDVQAGKKLLNSKTIENTISSCREIADDIEVKNLLSNAKNTEIPDRTTIKKLTKACQDLMMNATTTDHVEKLKTAGFNLSQNEYKTVMQVMYGEGAGSALEESMIKSLGKDEAEKALKGFNAYKREFMDKIANWKNDMTPDLSRRTVTGVTNSANSVERNNLVGKPMNKLIQDGAKQMYNSKTWLAIFGGAMIALTAATLTAGLFIGRKGEAEKQAEKESGANGQLS